MLLLRAKVPLSPSALGYRCASEDLTIWCLKRPLLVASLTLKSECAETIHVCDYCRWKALVRSALFGQSF
jgi:hypothetical protein